MKKRKNHIANCGDEIIEVHTDESTTSHGKIMSISYNTSGNKKGEVKSICSEKMILCFKFGRLMHRFEPERIFMIKPLDK